MRICLEGVHAKIDGVSILHGFDLDVAPRTMHGLVGPNGSGKSTALRCLYRSLRPSDGAVFLGTDDLWREMTAREAARRRAVVAQDNGFELDFTVRDVVAMARTAHKRIFENDTESDHQLIDDALAAVDMSWSQQRLVTTLSGGERQRVFLARAIAQEAPILLLDEPTNHLDIRAQLELLTLVKNLKLTTIAALHDLDHAMALCDTVSVVERGIVVANGPTSETLTVEVIREVFGVNAHVGTHPLTHRPHLTFAVLPGATP